VGVRTSQMREAESQSQLASGLTSVNCALESSL